MAAAGAFDADAPAYAMGAAEAEAASWLDVIPGGRAAYNFVVRELSRFNLVGLQDIPRWRGILNAVSAQARSADSVTQQLFAQATSGVADLEGAYVTLADKITSLLAQLRGVGLGVVPVGAIAAAAAAVIAVAGGLVLFFQAASERQQQVADVVNRLVALGKLSGEQAAALLRGGSFGSVLDSLGSKLVLGAVVVGALYVLSQRRGAHS